jgi:hypothetical protein
MKWKVTIYRATTIRTSDLISVVNGPADKPLTSVEIRELVKAEFYPQPPGFKIFYAPSDITKTTVGFEAMCFDIVEEAVPMAALVSLDPMDPQDVARMEGAVEGELNRMGLSTNYEGYNWYAVAEKTGN